MSIRDDELGRLGALKARLPDVFANARPLDRLDRDSARAAILGPLQRWNELEAAADPVDIEPELVEAVLAQAASGDGKHVEAPYLQLVLERVWRAEAERGSRLLRSSTLEELGGAEEIVREHLDRAMAVLDLEQQEAAARMFGHLVTPSGTKIAHRASDLATFAHVGEAPSSDLLAALGRERILRPLDDGEGTSRRYEIFHDVLAQAILQWGQRRDLLAERLAVRRRQRRLLAVAAGALVAAAVMVAVTVYALAQRGEARTQTRHARALALAAGALAERSSDPELGLLLGREAAAYDRTPTIEGVLRTALQTSRARAVLRGQSHGVLAAGFVAGGRVATVDGTGTLRTFPPRTSRPISTQPLGGRIRAAAFAADGSAVVVARRRLVEVRSMSVNGRSFAFRERSPVRAIAIDARGDRVAVATLDGRVTLHNAGGSVFTARPVFAPASLALDTAGRTLAAAGGSRVAV
jgi:Novel STAND NTPase 1